MATETEEIQVDLGPDGKRVLSNITDTFTGKSIEFKEIDTFIDGTPMTDDKLDPHRVLFIKREGKYYQRTEYLDKGVVYASWFGAVGDSVTDDTDAIQRCLDSVNHVTIIYQSVYAIYRKLTIPQGTQTVWRGEGKNSANGIPFGVADGIVQMVWRGTDPSETVMISCDDPVNCYTNFQNIHFNNRTTRTDVDGMALSNYTRGHMKNVTFHGFRDNLTINGYSYYANYQTCLFGKAHRDSVVLREQPNHSTFENCLIRDAARYGLWIDNGQTGLNFTGTWFEKNSKAAIWGRNCKNINFRGCYFEQNGSQDDATSANIIVNSYNNTLHTETSININGGYAYSKEGVDFIRAVTGENVDLGDIKINIESFHFQAGNYIKPVLSTPVAELSCVLRVPAGSSLSKVHLKLSNIALTDPETAGAGILPIQLRPMDYGPFKAYNCSVTKRIRPEWDMSTYDPLRELNYAPQINYKGENGDTTTTKFIDFPAVSTGNVYTRFGRNTATTGEWLVTFHDGTSEIKGFINVRTGEIFTPKISFGLSSGAATISSGSVEPEGSVSAPTGSIYLQTGTTSLNVWHKVTGTDANGWRSLVIEKASQAEVNTGEDDSKFITPLTLNNKLKQGALSSSQSEQATDETDIVAKYNALQARFEELVSKLNQIVLQ